MDDYNLRSNLEEEATSATLSEAMDEFQAQLRNLRDQVMAGLPAGQLSPAQIKDLLSDLSRLTERNLTDLGHKDSSCPICITPYLAIIAEEEIAIAMDSPAHPVEELGVTRLSKPWQCGHIFCRRDISKWIIDGHDSCPMCRRHLLEPIRPSADHSAPSVPQPDDPLASFVRRLQERGNFLQSFDTSFVPPGLPSREATGQIEEDRTQFSGMYS